MSMGRCWPLLRIMGGMESDREPMGGFPVPTQVMRLVFSSLSLLSTAVVVLFVVDLSSHVVVVVSMAPHQNQTIADCPRSVMVPTMPNPGST